MLRFYGLSYRELMNIPVRTFWLMSHTIPRIESIEDQRQFRVANNAQGGEQASEYLESLQKRVGSIYVIDEAIAALEEERDETGFMKLKMLAATQK